ncbi:glycoside hydrolase family 88 protein [Kiritimatiellaeota bacterium B1221]|nr:glycoside hydrolase family 88 protein [Kiritimatiellaeota bacterium B1221]
MQRPTENLFEFADALALKHVKVHQKLGHYTGIVTLHGLARLATESGKPEALARVKDELKPFLAGEMDFHCNFPNYRCGGNATAWLLYKGLLPEAEETVRFYADEILNDASKDPEGILQMPKGTPGRIWIDVAFAVTPFLIFAGMALNEEKYIEEGVQQTFKMVDIFGNTGTGLLHQSRGFCGEMKLSDDHWSRGNGWGAYALCELACELPENHKHKAESILRFKDLMNHALNYQNAQGLWHQEMTWNSNKPACYVETSGSGLLLYALGAGIKAGIADDHWMEAYRKGLRGLLGYISSDYDVYHTCKGCLCPGEGRKIDYAAMPPLLNDVHAFGPLVLCYGQASHLGLSTLGEL